MLNEPWYKSRRVQAAILTTVFTGVTIFGEMGVIPSSTYTMLAPALGIIAAALGVHSYVVPKDLPATPAQPTTEIKN